jgi:hypothetical protein
LQSRRTQSQLTGLYHKSVKTSAWRHRAALSRERVARAAMGLVALSLKERLQRSIPGCFNHHVDLKHCKIDVKSVWWQGSGREAGRGRLQACSGAMRLGRSRSISPSRSCYK